MINATTMIPEQELRPGESDVGLDLVKLVQEARVFLLAHEWCLGIQSIYYDMGIYRHFGFIRNAAFCRLSIAL